MAIDVPTGVTFICYADDLAIMATVTADTKEELVYKGNKSLDETGLCMRIYKLQICKAKVEAIILNQRGKVEEVIFENDGFAVIPK